MATTGTSKGRKERYVPIRDYALIGDCHGAAPVARGGSIDWCCLERFDAEPVLARILDAERGGFLEIRPKHTADAHRSYVPGTIILRTVFSTSRGQIAVTDFMPVKRSDRAGSHDFVQLQAPGRLVRLIEGIGGSVRLNVSYRPLGPGWGSRAAVLRKAHGGVVAQNGPVLYSDVPLALAGDTARASVEITGGQQHCLVLAPSALDTPPTLADAQQMLASTRAFWEAWSTYCCYQGAYPEAVQRSLLVLKLLTYAPTGAIAAAPTTSLPEALGGSRNWDYRYCWLRDGALVLHALTAMGYSGEADRFLDFHRLCCMKTLPAVQVMYGVGGEIELPERSIGHLEGYCGSRPVRVRNAAYLQTQIDIYGEVLDWAYTYYMLGGRIDREVAQMLRQLADFVVAHWDEPDHGIWEMRCPPCHYVHGKVLSWVALDRASRLFGDNSGWRRARTAILEAIRTQGIDPDGGHFLQAFGRSGTDAALLLVPQLGFPFEDAMFARTVAAIEVELRCGDYLRRYAVDDGLQGDEGAFLLCSFWLVDALLYLGRRDDAQALFENLLSKANDIGLYAEEIDPDTDAFLGNFPQAFTHLALINSALGLQLYDAGGRAALAGTYGDRARRCVAGDPGLKSQWGIVLTES